MYYFGLGTTNLFLDTTLFYIVPYGLLSYIGYNYHKMKAKHCLLIVFISVIAFITLGVYYYFSSGTLQPVNITKFPPRLYYLSYGIMCSVTLLLVCSKHNFRVYSAPIIKYISVHSMWIYLWHILVLDVYFVFNLPEIWWLKFFFVYFVSILIVYVQNTVLDLLEKKLPNIRVLCYFRG